MGLKRTSTRWTELAEGTNSDILRWAEGQPCAQAMLACAQDPQWQPVSLVRYHGRPPYILEKENSEPPLATILAQNRRWANPVPERVIPHLAETLEPPTIAECHDLLFGLPRHPTTTSISG